MHISESDLIIISDILVNFHDWNFQSIEIKERTSPLFDHLEFVKNRFAVIKTHYIF